MRLGLGLNFFIIGVEILRGYFLASILTIKNYKRMYFFAFLMIFVNVFLQLSVIYAFQNNIHSDFNIKIIIYVVFSSYISITCSIYRTPIFSDKIISGDYIVYAIRPLRYISQFIFEELSFSATFGVIYSFVPIVCALIFVNSGIYLNYITFLLSYILSLILATELTIFIYSLTVFTQKNSAIKALFHSVCALLSGSMIPIVFLPDAYIRIIQYLPFASIVNTPIQLLFGSQNGNNLILCQIIWILLFYVFNLIISEKILKFQRHIGG